MDWRDKLHPVFFELAELNRQFESEWKQAEEECKRGLEALGSRASPELRAKAISGLQEKGNKLVAWITEKLVDINRRYGSFPYNSLAYSYLDLTAGQSSSDDDHFAAYLHWLRHRESLMPMTARATSRPTGSLRERERTSAESRIKRGESNLSKATWCIASYSN
jgi:hypothetical protein